MTKSFYNPQDIEQLKSFEHLKAYCDATLGTSKKHVYAACPWGTHSKEGSLHIQDKDGLGYAYCFKCGRGGTVIDVASGLQGLEPQAHFRELIAHVAELTGYHLTPAPVGTARQASRPISPIKRQEPTPAPKEGEQEQAICFLDSDKQAMARQAVQRAHDKPQSLQEHAHLLGLPVDALNMHIIKESAPFGMIGLDARMRLCYIYLAQDEQGRYKPTGFKVRSRPEDIEGGAQRFYMYGKKSSLWGAPALHTDEQESKVRICIITEGESDAIAVRYSLHCVLEGLAHHSSDTYPKAEHIPLVLARPDASTFSPAWAAPLQGLDVILTIDNDDTGAKSAQHVVSTLYQAGVHCVWSWHASGVAKDPRGAFQQAEPCELFLNILHNKQKIENITST